MSNGSELSVNPQRYDSDEKIREDLEARIRNVKRRHKQNYILLGEWLAFSAIVVLLYYAITLLAPADGAIVGIVAFFGWLFGSGVFSNQLKVIRPEERSLEKIALSLQNIQDYQREKDDSLLEEARRRVLKIRFPILRTGSDLLSAEETSSFREELNSLFDGLQETMRRISFCIKRKEAGDLEKASDYLLRLAYVFMHPRIASLQAFLAESKILDKPPTPPQKQGRGLSSIAERKIGQLFIAVSGGLLLTLFGAIVFSAFSGQTIADFLHANSGEVLGVWAAISVGLLLWMGRGK